MEIRLIAPWVLLIISLSVLVWYAVKIKVRNRSALLMRLGLVTLMIIGYFGLIQSGRHSQEVDLQVLLIDSSDSIDPLDLSAAHDFAEDWQEAGKNRMVIAFGEQAAMVVSGQWPEVNSQAGSLAAAFDLAVDLLDDTGGRIIIATDGALKETANLDPLITEAAGHSIELEFIHLSPRTPENDLYLGEIIGPIGVWENSDFTIRIPIFSPAAQRVSVDITVNGVYQGEMMVKVQPGENLTAVHLQSGRPGIMVVGVTIKLEDDQFEQNNSIYSSYQVYQAPRVLLVSRGDRSADNLSQALTGEGVDVDRVSPEALTASRSQLEEYQAVLLFDLLSQELNFEQMTSLESFVVDHGRSLIVLGGRNSYNLGGYEGTLLEPLLPVSLAVPERIERHPTTYVMVLDRSGSMNQDEASDISPIELTKEAAVRAIETLRPEDYLGLLTFNAYTKWDVDISEVGEGISLRLALDAVSQIKASGGTEISQALQEALARIIETKPTDFKHILLMSDGTSDNDEDTEEKFETLTAIARRQNISISTIALGYESDADTLSFIAHEGNGRFYQVIDPTDLPGVMVSESKAAHSENIQLGETNIVTGIINHPVLNGIEPDTFPGVFGYNAVSSKEDLGAEDILLSGNFNDPLLSSWQVGHGHVVAWMGDMGAEWIPGMESWSRAGEFWRQVIQVSLPNPDFNFFSVDLDEDGEQGILTFKLNDPYGFPVNHLSPEFIFSDHQNLPYRVEMMPIGSGEYQAEFQIPPFGGYRGVIQYEIGGRISEVGVPFTINFPDEWRFRDANTSEDLLEKWTKYPGVSLTSFEELLNPIDTETHWLANEHSFEILIGLLMILWPLEIAFRRWLMPWRNP